MISQLKNLLEFLLIEKFFCSVIRSLEKWILVLDLDFFYFSRKIIFVRFENFWDELRIMNFV